MHKEFDRLQDSWKEKVEAYRHQAMRAETTIDSLSLNHAGKLGKCLSDRGTTSAFLHEVVFALEKTMKASEEKDREAADMLTKDKKLYEQADVKVGLHAAEVSDVRDKIDTLADEAGTIDQELQTMPYIEKKASMLWTETAKLRKAVVEDDAIVAFKSGLRKEASAEKKAVGEFLPAV